MSGAPSADLLSQPRPDVTLAPRRRVEAQTPFDTRLQRARAKFDKAASGIKDKFTSAKKGAPPEINLRPEETALEELGQEDPFAGLFKEGAVKRPAPRPVTIDERARNDRDPTRHATRGSRRGRRLTATGLAATAALYAAPFSPYSPLRGSGSTDMVRDQTTLQIRSSPAGNENSVIESKKPGILFELQKLRLEIPLTHTPRFPIR